jgi:hypothetical protein
MTYTVKPLSCEPTKLKGLSEKLIVSHWENNYGGAVRRLNAIATQLAELDFAKTPVFVINGLKREELIATNSMILHELYFDRSAATAFPAASSTKPWRATSEASIGGGPSSSAPARHSAAGRAGSC